MERDVVSLLAALVEKGSIPLSVSLREDQEVMQLKATIAELEGRVKGLQDALDRAEYLFRCESILNNKLTDIVRDHGIALGPEFFARPY